MFESISILLFLCLNNIYGEQIADISKIGLHCVPIKECPYILDLLQEKPLTTEIKEFIFHLKCGGNRKLPKVWCTEAPTFRIIPPALLNYQHCGFGIIKESYIIIGGGVDALLEEFPWMAILEYRNRKNELKGQCGGTLISRNYILTAAHCLLIHESTGKLESVTLGEYDTYEESEEKKRYNVDKYIIHPLYEGTAKIGLHHHDIGLVKLKEHVEYTDNINAICLPNSELQAHENRNSIKYIAAGWGITEEGYVSTSILQKLEVPLYNSTNCTNTLGYNVLRTQMCAGGEPGKDSCKGDSGGPLMARDVNKRVYQVGIISLSIGKSCGIGRPNIYTNVRQYLGWIYQNVKE